MQHVEAGADADGAAAAADAQALPSLAVSGTLLHAVALLAAVLATAVATVQPLAALALGRHAQFVPSARLLLLPAEQAAALLWALSQ